MYLYEELLKDEYIKTIYNGIENNPRIPISHGMHHILNVLNYCKRLAEIFDLNREEKEHLYTAALMHDVAQVFLQPHHAQNGAFIVKEMLENNEGVDPLYIKSKVDIERVCNIVKCHGGKKEEEYDDKLSCFLILADKLDITKDRLREAHKKYSFLTYMNYIEEVKIDLENNELIIRIITNKQIDFIELNKEEGIERINNILKIFCKKFNLAYKIIVESKVENNGENLQ